ncbi:putative L-ascorbate peroxidase 7, chloroplastic [Orobanche minor]
MGGANGSLRFEIELKHGANAGLLAIEEAGGPKIPMKYGIVDVSAPEQCPEEGRLPEYSEKFAADKEAFFKDYAEAHAKLSNRGAKFDPAEVH